MSLLAAFFGLAGVASGAAVSSPAWPRWCCSAVVALTALTTSQLQSLAYVFLRLQAQGSNVPGVLSRRRHQLRRQSVRDVSGAGIRGQPGSLHCPGRPYRIGALTLRLLVVGLNDERW